METSFILSTPALRSVGRRAPLASVVVLLLAAVFAWSAGGKLLWPTAFGEVLNKTGLFAPSLLPFLARGVPAAELVIALLLAIRATRPIGLIATCFASATFAMVHFFLIATGEVVPCGCAGISIEFHSLEAHVALGVLTSLMVIASIWLLLRDPTLR